MSKKILILGAGYAGIEAALTLQKKKKKSEDIEITLIDKNSFHTLLTELHEVAGNRIEEEGNNGTSRIYSNTPGSSCQE
jgi:NADH dehydrogenase